MWKMKMNEKSYQGMAIHSQIKTNESSIRQQCRITCCADVVIQHILLYLIDVADEDSDSESDANDVDDNESSDSE